MRKRCEYCLARGGCETEEECVNQQILEIQQRMLNDLAALLPNDLAKNEFLTSWIAKFAVTYRGVYNLMWIIKDRWKQ